MTEQESLYRTVCEHADDDTPRLVYADWLQEHGQDHRAEFIRGQVQLAGMSPRDADFIPLSCRTYELGTSYSTRWLAEMPTLIGVSWRSFQRGFPELARIQSPVEIEGGLPRCMDGIAAIAQLTPVPTLELGNWSATSLSELLDTKGVLLGRFSGLSLTHWRLWRNLPVLSASPRLRGFRRLHLNSRWEVEPFEYSELAESTYFDQVESLDLQVPSPPAEALARLLSQPAFDSLRELHLRAEGITDATLTALAALPPRRDVHSLSLHLGDCTAVGLRHLATSGVFPNLARLHLRGMAPGWSGIVALADGDWRLSSLYLDGCRLEDRGLGELIRSGLLASVRELDLSRNHVTEKGMRALANSADLGRIQKLSLDRNQIGPDGLAALADSPFLGELLSLKIDRNTSSGRSITPTDMEHFLTRLNAPRLREMWLSSLPLEVEGARALARSKSLTELRVLQLNECLLDDEALECLLNSPHFTGLMRLDLEGNQVQCGMRQLTNPELLSELTRCGLRRNPTDDGVLRQLRDARRLGE